MDCQCDECGDYFNFDDMVDVAEHFDVPFDLLCDDCAEQWAEWLKQAETENSMRWRV